MSKQKQLQKFLDKLAEYGDEYFSSGSKKEDLANIQAVLKQQGYWSGISLRYYFDAEMNFIRAEERRFGNG